MHKKFKYIGIVSIILNNSIFNDKQVVDYIELTFDRLLKNAKIDNKNIKLKIMNGNSTSGRVGIRSIELTKKTFRSILDKPEIFVRILSHEIGHLEFCEKLDFFSNKGIKEKPFNIKFKNIRNIFKESRADWRSLKLSQLCIKCYRKSFQDEIEEYEEDMILKLKKKSKRDNNVIKSSKKEKELEYMKSGYFPYRIRQNLFNDNIHNLIELENKVIEILKNEFNIELSYRMKEIIIKDRLEASKNFV